MTVPEVKMLQNVQLQIMDEIHRICVECGLRYYLIGGSAIGAKRHQGIIPWDLDVDIAMPRDDYEHLIVEFPQRSSSKYSLHCLKTDRHFDCPHILIVLNDSTIVFSDGDKNKRYGIFVDVLPLDQCPNDEASRTAQANELKRIKKLIHKQKIVVFKENGLFKRIAKKTLRFMYNLISRDCLNKWQQSVMMRYDKRLDCTHWCSMASHYDYKKLCMPKEYFGTPVLMDFSGRQYYVPERIDDYLECLFGDYTIIPSIEKQQAQMDSVKYAEWKDDDGRVCHVGGE